MENYPLLWRRTLPAKKPTGRPPRLSVDAVVAAAIRIADADGLEAASMARVAADLGVATMTLYTYVPSRADLIAAMVDDVLLARHLAATEQSWRDRVAVFAERTREMFVTHPWLTEVSLVRPPLGPGTMAEREFLVATMTGAGVPAGQINRAALAVTAYVYAFAREAGEDARLSRISGQSTESWWLERGEFWEKWFDVEAYPAMTALWNAGGFEDQAGFEYGLALLLDGIERSVE
ncbi:TetR/AcrR family transcriptional regulator C-terminal domain-containing protein [Actinoplanes sp. NEAU-A12]|uniref:TetR/AcrR family transcriptional regulator C-terminal domain-containing protein n=1 Tax=Actinoplanes sandaracinus TaxID=3045177 RepID=A0ABT6WD99_9ACTN|nr:TetR/AcrR family transcriptional regulator C-terminal domain-containing protein [Actinoplanes sandaracinus]MDI6097705.1 TetR/AcrR family transcriptional regulator C-terminal domain-containing protein [Actinoplanes sandaracinus]